MKEINTRMSRILAILIMMTALPAVVHGQDSRLGNWMIYFGNKSLGDRFNWHHEVQYRNYNAIGDLEQLLLRTGIGYDLSENNNNVPDSDQGEDVEEHRIFQQFITKQRFNRFSLTHRYRFEQRFIEDDFRMRFRYFLSLNVALNKPTMADKTLYLSAYNEIFLNTQDNAFDRNRLYGGLGYRLNDMFRFELGYMNQFLEQGGRDQLNIVTFLNF